MATLSPAIVKKIVRKLILPGEDYRPEVVAVINAQFLEFAIGFFKQVATAKIDNKDISADWYKETLMGDGQTKEAIALNAGINMKTIKNIYGTEKQDVVISVAKEHYESLLLSIQNMTEDEKDIDFSITIKAGNASVGLSIDESMIVINALAVKRAAMRGGAWSSVGKRAEKMLMEALCRLYSVDERHWDAQQKAADSQADFTREIDFFLISGGQRHKCEVKLMGKGNPESADAVIARASKVFVADTLSETNRKQFDSLGVHWVALKDDDGYKRFGKTLEALGIPHAPPPDDVAAALEGILGNIP